MTKQKKCIAPELKYVVNTLKRAGYRPKIIHSILVDAGEAISLRYIYQLYNRGN